MAEIPKVELGKETRKEILTALKNIKSQIQISVHRENTPADVAAEHIAGGGGLLGAAGAATAFKASKAISGLKNRFDPLAIVNRLTGGSKLATVLAGKLMGRSEKSIRSRAGLQPGMEEFSPTQMIDQEPQGGPTQDASEKQTTLLEAMVKSLAWIASHVSHIALKLDAIKPQQEIDLFKELVKNSDASLENQEQLKDAAAEQNAEFKKRAPMQVGKPEVKEKKEGGNWLSTIAKFLAPVLLPLVAVVAPVLAAFAGLATAAYLIYKNFDKFKLSFSLLGDSVQELYQTIVQTIQSIKEWVGNTISAGYDAAIDTGTSVVNTVKGVFGMAPTPEQQREELKASAAGGSGYAQRKLAKDVAPGAESASVLQQIAPKFADKLHGKDISPDVLSSTAESLRKGEYTKPAIQGLKGEVTSSGSPTRMATTSALSQMVGEAYGKLYKDAEGKPMRPFTDPNSGPRLEALTRDASNYLANALSPKSMGGPTQAPSAPATIPQTIAPKNTELSMAAPQTGQVLTQANDMQRNFALAPITAASAGGGTVINNVKNNNVQSATIHQEMAPARSEESSYLRSLDKGFAPA